MPKHDVKLHSSFLEYWGRLRHPAKQQIIQILRALEADPLYIPDSDGYLVAFDNEDSGRVGVITQHVKDWRGHQLVWIIEYEDLQPQCVRVRLRYEATIRIDDIIPVNY